MLRWSLSVRWSSSKAGRTINLSHHCIKPAIPKNLVLRKPNADTNIDSVLVPRGSARVSPPVDFPVPRTTAKPIRVCTYEDMHRLCPPQPCKCPPRIPPPTLRQRVISFLVFACKAGIAASVLYFTVETKFWKGSDETSALYSQLHGAVVPLFTKVHNESTAQIPRMDKELHKAKEKWNWAVTTVFSTILTAPETVKEFVKKNLDRKMLPVKPVAVKEENQQSELTAPPRP